MFGAISDPTRRAILQELGQHPSRVTDIAKRFPVSLNAVSKHLIVLEKAGLVTREVKGREHTCKLNLDPLTEASGWITEMTKFWSIRLDELERHILEGRNNG